MFVGFLLFFSILCFIEFIVFNEEILLALCFFSFVFFCFNSLSDSVYESFEARAAKIEADLLLSYASRHQTSVKAFENFLSFRGHTARYQMLNLAIISLFTRSNKFALVDATSKFKTFSFEKLAELIVIENKLVESFRKDCVSVLLYPLIFKTIKQQPSIFGKSSSLTISSDAKISALKSFSY
jgi:hypothetical protein